MIDEARGSLLGGCGLNGVNRINRFANLGYWVRSTETGRGIATAATRALSELGVGELGRAVIERGARWLVCLSGGKDSYTLLAVLHELKWRGLLPVDLLACNLDQGQPGFPATVLPEFLTKMGVEHGIEYQDTYSGGTSKIAPGGTMCSLC